MRFLRSVQVAAATATVSLTLGCAIRAPSAHVEPVANKNSCQPVLHQSHLARPELRYLTPIVQAAVDQMEADETTAGQNDVLFVDIKSLQPRLMELHGTAYTAENIRASIDRDFCVFEGDGLVGDVPQYGDSWQVIHFGSLVHARDRLIATVWSGAPCFERVVNNKPRRLNCLSILRLEMEEMNGAWVLRDKRVIGRS